MIGVSLIVYRLGILFYAYRSSEMMEYCHCPVGPVIVKLFTLAAINFRVL